MKKKLGFSLAEALITLLIVCIIAIASAPIITKKNKAKSESTVWTLLKSRNIAHPVNNRDIMLGSPKDQKGIVVYGTLYFKNRKGEVIGWIKEDGTSSFITQNPLENLSQEQLDAMVKTVSDSLKRQNIDMTQKPIKSSSSVIGAGPNVPEIKPAAGPNVPVIHPAAGPNVPDIKPASGPNVPALDGVNGMNIDLGELLKSLQQ